jgi:hypothetical protein
MGDKVLKGQLRKWLVFVFMGRLSVAAQTELQAVAAHCSNGFFIGYGYAAANDGVALLL